MKDLDKDILSDKKEDLKNMPFTTPEGYFENFKMDIGSIQAEEDGQSGIRMSENPIFRKLSPYIAMAAMFAAIVAAGTALMKMITPQEDMQEYGSLAYIDMIPVTEPEAIYYSYNHETEDLTDEDIVNYLIYSGTDLEKIDK